MSELLSAGVERWLGDEISESRTGRNSVLDDFEVTRQNYLLDPDDVANRDANKISGHVVRFRGLVGALEPEDLWSDYIAGKVIHHALMFVSGGFRTQCFLEADSAEAYERLRFEQGRVAGVDVSETVSKTIERTAEQTKRRDIARLLNRSLAANATMSRTQKTIYQWFKQHPERAGDAIAEDEEPVQATLKRQRIGISLAVSHITMAAEIRGGLGEVPILEAKSITDASRTPMYPFAL